MRYARWPALSGGLASTAIHGDFSVRNLSVGEYAADWHDAFLAEMAPWVASGEVRYREDIREGFEVIPTGFAEMLVARTSARPWSASRRIPLSHHNAGEAVKVQPKLAILVVSDVHSPKSRGLSGSDNLDLTFHPIGHL